MEIQLHRPDADGGMKIALIASVEQGASVPCNTTSEL
jgi:hypothetical protein